VNNEKEIDVVAMVRFYIKSFSPSDFFVKNGMLSESVCLELDLIRSDEISGWFNSALTFYTYRTTATGSDKYYYGVKRLHIRSATINDCNSDNYFGSGSRGVTNKFRNWSKKHKESLQKEVISIYSNRPEAYKAEKELVGDLWRDDPLCLNSSPGGAMAPPRIFESSARGNCAIHGDVGFIGDKCRACINVGLSTKEVCELHGVTSHYAGSCRRCLLEKSLKTESCAIHGDTLFQNGKCLKCGGETKVSTRRCSIHGETSHLGGTCALCTSSKVFSDKSCPIHGATRFVGDKCSKCIHSSAFYMDVCATHGETKHKGGGCYKCNLAKSWSKQDCDVHGEAVTFQGANCLRCTREKAKAAKAL
jgi:hypothetical protein